MSNVAWWVRDGDDDEAVVMATNERDAVERYLMTVMGVRAEDLEDEMEGWPENDDVKSFCVKAVRAEKAMKQFARGPVRLSQLLSNNYACQCPVCGGDVDQNCWNLASVKAYEALEDAADALRELVRLKDLKESDPAAHDAGKAAAWAAAWAAVRGLGGES